MKKRIPVLAVVALMALSGGVAQASTFGERVQDNMIFSSASDVPRGQERCIMVTRPFAIKSWVTTYYFPRGKYVGTKRHQTGYFFYAPNSVKSNQVLFHSEIQGLYLDNRTGLGSMFGVNPRGFDARPVRGDDIPRYAYPYIKRVHC